MQYNINEDGITHINAYSKSKIEIGRALSNFARAPFTCEDGPFMSIEAYWYWLSSPSNVREQLRPLYGWQAKKIGQRLSHPFIKLSPQVFERKICAAIDAKYRMHPRLQELLLQYPDIPIVHYYYWESKNPSIPPKVTIPTTGLWLWGHWNKIKEENA